MNILLLPNICFSTSYIFIIIMWIKQATNACFNLFLVLLLSQIPVAVFDNAYSDEKLGSKK
jgi:hypothetical protein